MGKFLSVVKAMIVVVLAALALATTSNAKITPTSTCGSQDCLGGGAPPCNDLTLGSQYSPGDGHTYVCVFGYPDYWARVS
jgi:hypothetical protein